MRTGRKARKWIVFFCFVILPAVFFYNLFREMETDREINSQYYASLLGVRIEKDGAAQDIHAWKDENGGNYFLFLPSHANTSRVSFRPDTADGVRIRIDGEEITAGTDIARFKKEVPYDLEFVSGRGNVIEAGRLTIYGSSRLASAYVTTKTGSMDYIQSSKAAKEEGKLLVLTPDGEVDYEGELTAVKGRGNATWEYPKKPYNIKLKEPGSVLGLREGSQFSLLANWADKSFLRNKIAYEIADGAGLVNTPGCEFLDLYLNGEYAGTYQITEKVSAPEKYFMEMEIWERWQDEPKGVRTRAGQAVTVKAPADISYDEVDEIGEKLQELEDAVYAGDGKSPDTGRHFTQILDLDSWVKVYLVQEIMQNYDAYVSSLFMYMADLGDSPIYCGPVWDFDWTLIARDGTFEGVLTANQSRSPFTNYWMPALYSKPEFYGETIRQYEEVFFPIIKDITGTRIEEYSRELEDSMTMNAARWNLDVAAWDKGVEDVTAYLAERSERLHRIWTRPEDYYKVHVDCGSDSFADMDYYVEKGGRLENLPEGLNRAGYEFAGWFYQDSDREFDVNSVIDAPVSIRAEWKAAGTRNVWTVLKDSGILQVRYLLSAAVAASLLCLIAADRVRNGKKTNGR